jgi:hypothetical protein
MIRVQITGQGTFGAIERFNPAIRGASTRNRRGTPT